MVIEIDGSEGGGQLLRTSLSLSAILGKPFRITDIRGAREKSGLQRQHLTCVNALAEISGAETEGAALGSREIFFAPHCVAGGKYFFDIGSAGSVTLLLQALLPPLCFAEARSEIRLAGGTNVAWSPPAEFVQKIFLPELTRMGARTEFSVKKRGFYPKGGGLVEAVVEPAGLFKPLELTEKGKLLSVTGEALVAELPASIAEREKSSALKKLVALGAEKKISVTEAAAASPGTQLFLTARHEFVTAGFSSLGELGKPAERVGEEAAQRLIDFENSGAAVDEHLGDQLLLYAALAKGKSRLRLALSKHVLTNVRVIEKFLGKVFEFEGEKAEGAVSLLEIKGAGFEKAI